MASHKAWPGAGGVCGVDRKGIGEGVGPTRLPPGRWWRSEHGGRGGGKTWMPLREVLVALLTGPLRD